MRLRWAPPPSRPSGAGVLGSIEEIAGLVPPKRGFAPRSVPDERAAWREFVAWAAKLGGP